jgi:hypothetical protein
MFTIVAKGLSALSFGIPIAIVQSGKILRRQLSKPADLR